MTDANSEMNARCAVVVLDADERTGHYARSVLAAVKPRASYLRMGPPLATNSPIEAMGLAIREEVFSHERLIVTGFGQIGYRAVSCGLALDAVVVFLVAPAWSVQFENALASLQARQANHIGKRLYLLLGSDSDAAFDDLALPDQAKVAT